MDNKCNKISEKVSVIVPIYNSRETLPTCIDSLLRQTYSPLEIILVNDGSLDDSLSVCRAYEQGYENIVVVNKANGGVSSARNAGIDRSTGDFIMFVDSDDWVEPNYCEVFIRHFEKESLIFSDPSSVSLDTEHILRMKRNEALLLRGVGIESPCSKLFEASVIKKECIRFPERLSLGEDFIFVLNYLSRITGDLLCLQCSVYHYERQDGESLSNKIPSCEQVECFYAQLVEAAKSLKIRDAKSRFILDRSCMLDLEKRIASDAKNRSMGFRERYRRIRRSMTSNVFKKTCHVGVGSKNIIYELLYKKRMAFLLSIYYMCKR